MLSSEEKAMLETLEKIKPFLCKNKAQTATVIARKIGEETATVKKALDWGRLYDGSVKISESQYPETLYFRPY